MNQNQRPLKFFDEILIKIIGSYIPRDLAGLKSTFSPSLVRSFSDLTSTFRISPFLESKKKENKPENPFQTMISQISLFMIRVYPRLPEPTQIKS